MIDTGRSRLPGQCRNAKPLIEPALEATLQGRRQLEGVDEVGQQAGVAQSDIDVGETGLRGRLQREDQDLGIGGCRVASPETFQPRLEELAGVALLGAKDRSAIGVVGLLAGISFEVCETDRDRVLGPEAKLASGRIACQDEARADGFA